MRSKMVKVITLLLLMNLAGAAAPAQQPQKQPKKAQQAPPPQGHQTAPEDFQPQFTDTSGTALSREDLKKLKGKVKNKLPQGKSFYIAPITETPGHFSLLISDADNRSVTGNFLTAELNLFEAIMIEAQKFAENEEAVGVHEPIYTRFFNKQSPAFIIDVGKVDRESRFYVTVKTLSGNLTVEAGAIKRGMTKEALFLDDILSRVQAVKSGS